MNVEDEKGWRPLHHAAYSGSHRVLQLLLNAPGVDVTGASNKGRRPIDACRTVEAARMLLDAGAVHAAAVPGVSLTALHHAAGQGRLEVVELLLDLGAKASETFSPKGAAEAFNHPGHFGGTALHLAALGLENARGQKKSLGASFGVYMPDLVSVHDAAERRVAVCAALLRAGADVNARTIPGPAPREQAPTSHNCRVTPLLLAAETGDAAVIKELLRAGAKADTVFGTPPNHCFSAMNAAAYFGHADAIRALVAAGADVDVRAVNGGKRAPLLDAVAQNHHSAVRALLELGADSTRMEGILALPVARRPRIFAENVMDETTRALLAQHRSGRLTPSRACSLPDCEARRRADYDDKKLLKCPCKVRRALVLQRAALLSFAAQR